MSNDELRARVRKVSNVLSQHMPSQVAEERARNIVQGSLYREPDDPPVANGIRRALSPHLVGGIHVTENVIAQVADIFSEDCKCVTDCAEDPDEACSLSGTPHVHPDDGSGCFGPCPAHPEAPGDL